MTATTGMLATAAGYIVIILDLVRKTILIVVHKKEETLNFAKYSFFSISLFPFLQTIFQGSRSRVDFLQM
jgi:hypothetical protein